MDGRSGRRGPRSWLARRAHEAVENRTVFSYLVLVFALTAVVTGLIAHLIDRKDFATFGVGVWWAVVTLGTVGYGDVVPHTAWGRVLGGAVIVFGVTFISFLIAIVTSMLVETSRAEVEAGRDARHQETLELIREVVTRLDDIESRLGPKRGA